MARAAALLLIALQLVLGAAAAAAEEVILSFHARVVVAADGELTVTETIRVRAEGRDIRRGIYRDFPTTVETASGRIGKVGFEVVSVRRNGAPEAYHVETAPRFVRVYIGHRDRLVSFGEHTYELTYRSDRQIRFFADHDELFWNVTGNAWDFPILAATADIVLPPGAAVTDTVHYTGPVGSTAANATAAVTADRNGASFAITEPLGRREGLTVGVSFPKGVVAAPSAADELGWLLRDNLAAVLGLATLLAIAGYYFWAWLRVGRDPPAGVVVPRWDAPDGISPALVNYIDNKGLWRSQWQAVSAALIDLAVKGYVTLDDLRGTLTIVTTGKPVEASLPAGEAALLSYLQANARDGRLTVDTANGTKVVAAAGRFRKAIDREHREDFYRLNTGYVLVGVALSAAGVAAMLWASGTEFGAVFAILVASAVAATWITTMLGHLFAAGASLGRKIVTVVATVIGGAALTSVGLTTFLVESGSRVPIASTLGLVVLNVLFYHLLGAPTPIGRRMMDGIEGLKLYITMAERDRLNLQGAPAMSPSHFETVLPYAVALGLERPWTRAFEAWLATAAAGAAAGAVAYSPNWYGGGRLDGGALTRSLGGLSRSMQDSFTASLPTPKSSSSGFSGGGGGGSGGGGGGGW